MGTSLTITAQSPHPEITLQAIGAAFDTVRWLDQLLSTWREDTELSRLNRAPVGKPFKLSPTLAALLEEVRTFRKSTGGTFDPSIGALVDAYDLRGIGRQPDSASLRAALEATGLDRFELDRHSGQARRLHPAWWIDSGGFGKGAALRAAADALRSRGVGEASLNFGGQVLVVGNSPALNLVAVSHPARRSHPVVLLRLANASVATSGQSERPGHILDPRSGQKVPPWGSASVVAQDPMAADILATALFVMGPEEACRWAAFQDEIGILLLIGTAEKIEARWNRLVKELVVDLDIAAISQPDKPFQRRGLCNVS
jgi:thiamine biosynthesis lipoprotein